jgi:hypothetical protein
VFLEGSKPFAQKQWCKEGKYIKAFSKTLISYFANTFFYDKEYIFICYLLLLLRHCSTRVTTVDVANGHVLLPGRYPNLRPRMMMSRWRQGLFIVVKKGRACHLWWIGRIWQTVAAWG